MGHFLRLHNIFRIFTCTVHRDYCDNASRTCLQKFLQNFANSYKFVEHLARQLRRFCIMPIRQQLFQHCPVRIGVCGAGNQRAIERNVYL